MTLASGLEEGGGRVYTYNAPPSLHTHTHAKKNNILFHNCVKDMPTHAALSLCFRLGWCWGGVRVGMG